MPCAAAAPRTNAQTYRRLCPGVPRRAKGRDSAVAPNAARSTAAARPSTRTTRRLPPFAWDDRNVNDPSDSPRCICSRLSVNASSARNPQFQSRVHTHPARSSRAPTCRTSRCASDSVYPPPPLQCRRPRPTQVGQRANSVSARHQPRAAIRRTILRHRRR